MNKNLLLIFFCILIIGTTYSQQILTGKVVAITDGDTFRLLKNDSTQLKIRVANIDCPENKQPFSQRSKQFTSEAIFGKNVELTILKKDRYGRSVALVKYNDSLDLSQELIKYGLAWHYVKYSNDQVLQELENIARVNKIGLWKDKSPIPPWEWRSRKRSN